MNRRRTPRLLALAAVAATAALAAGCSDSTTAAPPEGAVLAQQLHPEIVRELSHDPTAFTQGLEISDGTLYESTGRVGTSWVRATDLDTGAEIARADLMRPMFGEGVTVAGDTVWQITWKDGVAIARDAGTLAQQRQVSYDGEGWGLCTQADRLVMSNGSATLTFRDPATFDATGTVDVTLDGRPLDRLNELECSNDGFVYANVWTTDRIVKIDPATGAVVASIDAANLEDALPASERGGIDVLNGIAQIPGTDRFLVTGKLWPRMFEVRFVA
ncbi:glutaminyl-peptide cyclotransferase [Rhodococcus sp. SGAir0479]|uniref:glutaminyl-peptide cyclotransferase n=1 Tax=Rhodococcus sp. SGAir0479 TaxID=2567884 RepID=UPI0010CD6B70|nr:glutaminyl-peptide cyclotransferase [Rhodococcus sp. SGAir0479]QCQ89897.1 glutaminyl-peptide cyclotransferase [Rhodococcus sp. SGAir0479]